MWCKIRSIVLALTVAAAWSSVAFATDATAKGAARDLAKEAKRDFDAGHFEAAQRKFQQAYEVAKVPTLALWAARALVKQGQLVAASELYQQALKLVANDLWVGKAQQKAQADAGKELAELQPRIAHLRVRVEGGEASQVAITIDDVKIASALYGVEIPADPGRRRIVGNRDGKTAEQTIDLGEGERKEVVLKFPAASSTVVVPVVANSQSGSLRMSTPASPEPRSGSSRGKAQRTWGWVAVGVGAAGLITGAVTGIIVLSNSGLRSDCQNGVCDPAKVDNSKMNRYNLAHDLSTAGFIVGAVGTVVGVTLLLWTPKHESDPQVALWLGPGSAGVKGAF